MGGGGGEEERQATKSCFSVFKSEHYLRLKPHRLAT